MTKRKLREAHNYHFLKQIKPAPSQFLLFDEYIHKKILRPYISKHLDRYQRLQIVQDHHQFLDSMINIAQQKNILAQFEGKEKGHFKLELQSGLIDTREGDSSLVLLKNDVIIYRAEFSFYQQAGKTQVIVGCIQGINHPDGKSIVKQVTKEIFGHSPKYFLFFLLKYFCFYMGCKDLVLVSDKNQLFSRRKKKHFSYDKLALEIGGKLDEHGNYLIPCVTFQKSLMNTTKSSKRANREKKIVLSLNIIEQMKTSLEKISV